MLLSHINIVKYYGVFATMAVLKVRVPQSMFSLESLVMRQLHPLVLAGSLALSPSRLVTLLLAVVGLSFAGCTSSSSDDEIDDGGEDLESPTEDPIIDQPTSAGFMSNFLWKPEAESAYNRGNPIIHSNPCALTFVNGALVTEFGPGNGRCNTARLFERCGTFPANTKVEIVDIQSGLPYLDPNTNLPYVLIPSPCSRFEF